MRLPKFLAHAGAASRRNCEDLIAQGRVAIDGRIIREPGTQVAPDQRVTLDGRLLRIPSEHRYLVLHKPVSVMTTMHDPEGRRTVASLLPEKMGRIVPVGRLDYDTAGVLLLTDDGDLAHRLTHPRFGVEKTYRVVVRGRLAPAEIRALLEGVVIDGRSSSAKIRIVASSRETSEVEVSVHEGRNRLVRRMFDAIAHPVLTLTRVRFGPLSLGALPVGGTREPTPRELSALRAVARLQTTPSDREEEEE
jgi:23S rRNA pseudouridine2605 synthase